MQLILHTEPTLYHQVLAALSYAVTSLFITFTNKWVLTSFSFPSFVFLALCQSLSTIICVQAANCLGIVQVLPLTIDNLKRSSPLPGLYVFNVVSGLGGTKFLSLPMLSALRRFTILITVCMEGYLLNVWPTRKVNFSIFLMIFGALVAVFNDFYISVLGYVYIFVNNLATSSVSVVAKKKMETKDLGNFTLLYYSSVFSIPFFLAYIWYAGELPALLRYNHYTNTCFMLTFLASSLMGFLLNLSSFYCTKVNSATTTTVVGCIKNILTSYLGILLVSDYKWNLFNFIGINISIFGSLLYSYYKYKERFEL